jgi:hypothetical protein
MKKVLFVLLVACLPCSAKNKIVFFTVKTNDPTFTMEVILDSKAQGDYAEASKYRVVALTAPPPAGEWKWVDLKEVKFNSDQSLDLVPKDPDRVKTATQVMIMVGTEPGVFPTKYEEPKPGVKKAGKETSDVYINLSYSPAINSPPQYSIDTSVGLLFPIATKASADYGSLGFLAAVKTDKRKQADPDSYRVFGVYQIAAVKKQIWPVQGVLFSWLFGGAEFERQAENTNFISSPLLDFPIRLRGRINTQKTVVPVLIPEVGIELGNNFGNAVNRGGQGFIARGVLGGNFSVTFNPKTKLFQGIHLTSNYKLRLPAREEVFTDTATNSSGKTVDVPFLSTKPRHYIKNELGFTLWDPISLTITHEYGDIPPAFRLVDHKVTIGLTLSLQQNLRMTSGLTGK